MNLQRNLAAEREVARRGLKSLEIYYCKVRIEAGSGYTVAKFSVIYDPQFDYWTASFGMVPFMGANTMITVGAEPVVHADGAVHVYRSRLLAERACDTILKTLKVTIQ